MSYHLFLLLSLTLVWMVLVAQVVLTVAGIYYGRRAREAPAPDEWPEVSILVPARNEEAVLAGTLRALLALGYPEERMEIVVIDDGSTDGTRGIVEQAMRADRRVKLVAIPAGFGGLGKSCALNAGLRQVDSSLVAVYDADNRPEPSALRRLVAELAGDLSLAAAAGKVRTLNGRAGFLTRCIAAESASFQCMAQAGRWLLFGLCSLPGTNFVIRRSALARVGGWDERALADDAELTARLRQEGGAIKYVPGAVTWEPEPHTWRAWVRQRIRWARGGLYVVRKFAPHLPRRGGLRLALEIVPLVGIYHVFLWAVLLSDAMLLGELIRTGHLDLGLRLTALWIGAVMLFVLQTTAALVAEGESGPPSLFIATAMYFTYCQAWVYVCLVAHWRDLVARDDVAWDKTARVQDQAPAVPSHERTGAGQS